MQRPPCLDMTQVSWMGTNGFKETNCGIILEIDPAGGLVQASFPIPMELILSVRPHPNSLGQRKCNQCIF